MMDREREFYFVEENEHKTYKKRLFLTKINKLLKFVTLILTIIFAIVILVLQYKNDIYTGIAVIATTEKPGLESNSYINNSGNIITYSKDGISAVDGKGNDIWNITYEMQNPLVRTGGKRVSVCDQKGHIISIIGEDGKTSDIDTNLPIIDYSMSPEGRIAAILSDNDVSWINLYDTDGSQLVEIKATLSKTGYPMSVALSGEVMGVSYFYMDGETMRSTVTFYNFGGIGENLSDHIVSSYDYADGVIPVISSFDNENFLAIGDNRILYFQGNKKPVSTYDIILNENLVGAYLGSSKAGFVFYDNEGEKKYRLDIYDKTGNKDYSYKFDIDFKNIQIGNKQTVIYNEMDCIVLNAEGMEKFSGQFPEKIIHINETSNTKRYMAVTKEHLSIMEFE